MPETKTSRRCGAKTRRGGTCQNIPREGEKRCYKHGAGRSGKKGGRPILHGLYSKRLGELGGDDPEAAVRAAMGDTKLLDLKRTVALSTLLLQQIRLPDEGEVVDGAAANEIYERALRMLERHGRLQGAASRQALAERVILAGVLPLMRTFATRISELARRYIPEKEYPRFKEDVRTVLRITGEELVKIMEEASR